MNWRDFFYFSQGERRALAVLHCLLVGAWIYLLVFHTSEKKGDVVAAQEQTQTVTVKATSSVEERKERIRKRVYPKRATYPRVEKYPEGTVVELNSADTMSLKKVPGIGSTFARRIVKYRELLGGYAVVEQLGEVYGIDEERYEALKRWFRVDSLLITPLLVNKLTIRELVRHPYLSYEQAKVIYQQVKQKGKLDGWEQLRLLEEFTVEDWERIRPYLSFE